MSGTPSEVGSYDIKVTTTDEVVTQQNNIHN
ncbi:hypothetical protein [Staphylococcus epidermidis]